jgi:hypothetical protein
LLPDEPLVELERLLQREFLSATDTDAGRRNRLSLVPGAGERRGGKRRGDVRGGRASLRLLSFRD